MLSKAILKRHLKEKFAHYLSGVLAGLTLYAYTLFSIILIILFLIYEVSEWYIERDKLFPEIKEFTIGYVVGYMAYLILILIYI